MAVLGIEAEDGVSQDLASAITAALRQELTTSEFRAVPGRDLVEVKLVFFCPDEAPSCMVQVAESLNAQHLVFGSLKAGANRSIVLTLKRLDAREGKIRAHLSEPINPAQGTASALRGPARKWFAALTGKQVLGTMRVFCDVVGASVSIDGVPAGITTDGALELTDIKPGEREVVVSKRGHETVRRLVRIEAGGTSKLELQLAPTPVTPPAVGADSTPPAPDASLRLDSDAVSESEGPRGLQIAAWGTAGAAVLSLALAVKFGLDVRSTNGLLDPYRRFQCDNGLPQCSRDDPGNPLPPLSADERAEIQRLRKQGQDAETLQYVFLGVGGALAAGSAVLFYLAYSDEDGERAEARVAPALARVRLAPTLGPTGAGLSAGWRF